eukprot:TRINITY_DN12154_c0_g1_i1.p1 TRINITY_DN12154_c0_g1~~TRINITY_DN12154_c0_g1_i1.p1  ORF type:complete len:602 (+),score=188.04 TRINITY_DN12154_c0_g1_i1:72-1877(+)
MVARLPVLYGSQTGTAEDVAWVVARRLVALGFDGVGVGSIDSYGMDRLRQARHVVFVVSTTGQGDPPDNMTAVWQQLRMRKCEPLCGLHFSVLGLGDSSYEKYNYIGKMLHNRLSQLGGVAHLDKGMCDDQDVNGLDDALEPWMERMAAALKAAPHSLSCTVGRPEAAASLRYTVTIGDAADASFKAQHVDPHAAPAPHTPPRTTATVVANTRITPAAHWQAVHELQFRVPDAFATAMLPGCSLGIYPHNPPAAVAAMLKRLQLTGDERVKVRVNPGTGISLLGEGGGYGGVTDGMTVRALLTEAMDLCGVPRRRFFALCAGRCGDKDERVKLAEMGAAEGAEDLRFYCTRERRSFVEVLKDFASVDVTLAFLLEAVPPQKVRQYSISSMPCPTPTITVAVVEYKTPYNRPRVGLCSTYLALAVPGTSMAITLHAPTVQFPDPSTPVVLIGPGTGVAPCRSVIQARYAEDREAARGKLLLLFGCRNRAKDYLYGDEFEQLAGGEDPWLAGYHTAFSRDQDRKVYVQDVIRGTPEVAVFILRTLLEEGGAVYISGSAKNMPQSVEKALVYAFMKYGDATEEEGMDMLRELKKAKQIQYDTWS